MISQWLEQNDYGACVINHAGLAKFDAGQLYDWWQCNFEKLTQGYKLCWLILPVSAVHLVEMAVKLGFNYHSVQAEQLTLVYRLQQNAYVPLAATHSIGVGAVVFNPQGQVLLIKEQPVGQRPIGHWKLPGGMVDAKEHFAHAVVREVFEETGVTASFIGWVALRHHHKGQFGASNIYLVARLATTSSNLSPCPFEIAAAQWFEPEEYIHAKDQSGYNQQLVALAMQPQCWQSIEVSYDAGIAGFEFFGSKK